MSLTCQPVSVCKSSKVCVGATLLITAVLLATVRVDGFSGFEFELTVVAVFALVPNFAPDYVLALALLKFIKSTRKLGASVGSPAALNEVVTTELGLLSAREGT